MAKAAPKRQVVTLAASSPAATAGPADAVAAPAAVTAAARAAAATPGHSLLDYEPPALPAQPAAAAAFTPAGAARVLGFRVAAAAPTLPPVPITYDVRTRSWLLLDEYTYNHPDGYTLTAHQGYAFDLSSVPRPLWWLIAPNELSIVAPLFHDLIYEYKGRLRDFGEVNPDRTFTRAETDDLFLHLMEVEGVAWWRRNAAYSAVRAAGGIFWAT